MVAGDHSGSVDSYASFAPRHCRNIRIALLTPEAMTAWMTALVALDADAVPT